MFLNTQLKQVNRAVLRLLTDRCDIEQLSEALDAFGATLQTYAPVAQNVLCRVLPLANGSGDMTGATAEQTTMQEMYRLILPPGTAITINQRVRVGSDYYDVGSVSVKQTNVAFVECFITRRK